MHRCAAPVGSFAATRWAHVKANSTQRALCPSCPATHKMSEMETPAFNARRTSIYLCRPKSALLLSGSHGFIAMSSFLVMRIIGSFLLKIGHKRPYRPTLAHGPRLVLVRQVLACLTMLERRTTLYVKAHEHIVPRRGFCQPARPDCAIEGSLRLILERRAITFECGVVYQCAHSPADHASRVIS